MSNMKKFGFLIFDFAQTAILILCSWYRASL